MSEHRDRILAEACELYLSEGMDGFSMRRLAKAVGVTAPALYRHYESREAVLVDVLGEGYRLLARRLYGALGGSTPAERFLRAGGAHLDFALEHRRYYELIYTHPRLLGIDSLPEEIEAQACAIHQFFMDRLRECMSAGLIRPEDPERAALTMWGHTHGLISLYLNGVFTDDEGEPLDETAFRALHLESGLRLMRGMADADGVRRFEEALVASGRIPPTAPTADRPAGTGRTNERVTA